MQGNPLFSLSAKPQMMKRSSGQRNRAVAAETQAAEVTETGDFCIFESTLPVTIHANRSAVIPVFEARLEESKSILHYRLNNHPERPFQAIQFQNSTKHSLSRGVCTVYDQATYVGNCIVPSTATGRSALLPHALETSVKVRHQPHKIETRRIGLRIAAGVAHESYHKLLRTEYFISSHRDNKFDFVLDHAPRLGQCNVICNLYRKEAEPEELPLRTLKDGHRVEFELQANDRVKIEFVETSIAKSQVLLTGTKATDEKFQVHWLYENLIESNYSLAQTPSVMQCIELQKLLDEKNSQIQYARDEMQRLIARQERLRQNIKAGVGNQQTAKWQDNLARAEDNLVQLEEEYLPGLIVQRDECRHELFQALKALVLEWNEQTTGVDLL